MNSVKKLLAVCMTMAIAAVLSFGAVGCKKEETTKKEVKVEKKDTGGTETKTKTETETKPKP
jgi:hypothetical protein